MEIFEILAYNFKSQREAMGLSVAELAEKLDMSRQTIYNIESGQGWIDKPNTLKACKFFKISTSDLFVNHSTKSKKSN